MNRRESVLNAIRTMELEGFVYTQKEKELWEKIAKGELPLSAANEDARNFDKVMRGRTPENYAQGDE